MKPTSNKRSQGNGRGRTGFVLALAMIALVALMNSPALPALQLAAPSGASAASRLTITSPGAMAVVHPGETLFIEASVTPGAAFQFVTVVGEKSFGASSPLREGPYRFSFSVPENLSSGPHYFTAVGRAASGDMAASLPLEVDVENGNSPLSLKIDPLGIDLEALGEEIPIRALGTFAGGAETDLTQSLLLQFSSSNPAVATISPQGIVRAVAPGMARIVTTFRSPTGTMSSEIPATVQEFAVRLSAKFLEFGSQPQGMESAASVLTVTNPGSSPLRIRELRVSDDYHASGNCISAGPLPPGGSCAIAVTFEPSASGQRTGSLTIVSGEVSAATVVVLSGAGIAR
jgi:hypothetical protein